MTLPVSAVRTPSALVGQDNGRLTSSTLVGIPSLHGGKDVTLLKVAGRAFLAMRAAAEAAGIRLEAVSSYRTYAEQEAIFRERYVPHYAVHTDGTVSWRDWNGVRWYHAFGAKAAVPGSSNHGKGLAIDYITGSKWLAWMLAHAATYGWSWEIQSEEWHLHYFAGDSLPRAVLDYEAGLHPPTDPDPEDEDMTIYIWLKDNRGTTVPGAYHTLAEKPLVGGVWLYAMTGGTATWQSYESLAVAQYLAALAKKPLTIIGTRTKPELTVAADGKHSGWFSGTHVLDGPLVGIKK